MHKKDNSLGSDTTKMFPQLSWHTIGKAACKFFCIIIGLIISAYILRYGLDLAYERYHAKDLPHADNSAYHAVLYTEDSLPDHPALNVVQDNPDHDEQRFLKIYDVTPDANGIEPVEPECVSEAYFHPEPGHTYEAQIYCRNGADPQYSASGYGCTDAVYVQVHMPHKFTTKTWARKFGDSYLAYDFISVDIAADNIFPVAASDWVEFWSPDDLRFDYVKDSATYYDGDYPDGRAVNSKWLFAPGGALVNIGMRGGREYAWMIKFRFQVSKTKWHDLDAVIYAFQN